jgi:hypothetical protein
MIGQEYIEIKEKLRRRILERKAEIIEIPKSDIRNYTCFFCMAPIRHSEPRYLVIEEDEQSISAYPLHHDCISIAQRYFFVIGSPISLS